MNARPPSELLLRCREAGIPYATIRSRIKRGLSVDEAFSVAKKRGPEASVGGKTGGKSELSGDQIFIDALRNFYGLDPLYSPKSPKGL